jgi:hypothetical protein
MSQCVNMEMRDAFQCARTENGAMTLPLPRVDSYSGKPPCTYSRLEPVRIPPAGAEVTIGISKTFELSFSLVI